MIDPYIQQLINLFTATEWKAFVLLLAITLAATHTIKVAWRLGPIRGGSHGQVYLVSAAIALISSFWLWPPNSPWWVGGIIGGPASNIAFKLGFVLLKKFWPDGAAALNFDRRKQDLGAPAGTETRRSTDKPAP